MASVPTNIQTGKELEQAQRALHDSKQAIDVILGRWDNDEKEQAIAKALSALWQAVNALKAKVESGR
jgi:hypothetical protein